MYVNPETGKVTFRNIGDLLSESTKALSNTDNALEKAVEEGDKQARINALIAKALYMAYQMPNGMDTLESTGRNVPSEVKGVIRRLSEVASTALLSQDWDTVSQLPKTKKEQYEELPTDIIDRLAEKYYQPDTGPSYR